MATKLELCTMSAAHSSFMVIHFYMLRTCLSSVGLMIARFVFSNYFVLPSSLVYDAASEVLLSMDLCGSACIHIHVVVKDMCM